MRRWNLLPRSKRNVRQNDNQITTVTQKWGRLPLASLQPKKLPTNMQPAGTQQHMITMIIVPWTNKSWREHHNLINCGVHSSWQTSKTAGGGWKKCFLVPHMCTNFVATLDGTGIWWRYEKLWKASVRPQGSSLTKAWRQHCFMLVKS